MSAEAGLARLRSLIDRIDAGVIALAALRRRLVRIAATLKAPNPSRDPTREARVHAHAGGVALDLGLPRPTSDALMQVLIRDACELQGLDTSNMTKLDDTPTVARADPDQGPRSAPRGMIGGIMNAPEPRSASSRWLRRIPPPARIAPLLRLLPRGPQTRLFQAMAGKALALPLATGEFAFLTDRRVGIEVSDLGLSFVVSLIDGRLQVVDQPADASVRGTLVDLLLLASRVEDADTLFFQRRLILTGDTELGLLARNTLDRLDWESVPLALRILLHRAAGFARAAREAHHGPR